MHLLPLIAARFETVSFHAKDRLRDKDRGATAVEYGLLVGLIAVVIIAAVLLLGKQLVALFDMITAALAGPSGVTA
jgi:pilus assembly protein Flp/PilA